MTDRDEIRQSFQAHLRDGEEVVVAFPALRQAPEAAWFTLLLAVLAGTLLTPIISYTIGVLAVISVIWVLFFNQRFWIVATNLRTVVAKPTSLRGNDVGSIEQEVPPDTKLGPHKGWVWHPKALSKALYVNRQHRDDVDLADARVATTNGR